MKRCKFRAMCRTYRQNYKDARALFGREKRKRHRKNAGIRNNVRYKSTWLMKKETIPLEIYEEANTIICDKERVMRHWNEEFEKL